ncbi:MAG TPA: grasp-with-spasm system ATP-grasp peptide maturase [bacterium]|nr:grasp-with-spasm system ATP-grasp peptide maturase [bacterium]HMZ03345.1 grasp-with-spasm system ATP-grasp peptide maturase [bacterium]HNB08658.1 grasp-with-spasm system ATP-grasp peptide maturase [bacterium]HNB55328.1 grasp-with-spasm system ATP-grasp peptide maturase [bacterium]HND77415.1 grasp-with-spasm system ATP-grasp peptide maturase [bacterium]
MVLILTYDGDTTSDYIIEVLKNKKHPYLRLNSSLFFKEKITIAPLHKFIEINGFKYTSDLLRVIWFRRFYSYRNLKFIYPKRIVNKSDFPNLTFEFNKIIRTLYATLNSSHWLLDPRHAFVNKIEVLQTAKEIGLLVPNTTIINNKAFLSKKENSNLVSKSIAEGVGVKAKRYNFSMYTKTISPDFISKLPSLYVPSLVQERIKKRYDIRIFYLNGRIFASAIFSQNNERTIDDFRIYDDNRPNRIVPYKLPNAIKRGIRRLMKKLSLNIGAIDMVRSQTGEYYFLEVNPNGQFGMISHPCNYNLFEVVADYLIRNDK